MDRLPSLADGVAGCGWRVEREGGVGWAEDSGRWVVEELLASSGPALSRLQTRFSSVRNPVIQGVCGVPHSLREFRYFLCASMPLLGKM